MKKQIRQLLKAIIWKEVNLMSKFHVAIDRAAKWVLRKADYIKNENLRLWTKNVVKTLTCYREIDKEDEGN